MEYFELMKEFSELNPNQEEEMNMNTTKMSAVEQIKAEFCSRYGLDPSQLTIELTMNDVESVELADQIKNENEVEGAYKFLNSYKGYNMVHGDELQHYLTSLDYRSGSDSLGITIRTKKGVLKHD
jgi:hypothetical protein